MQNKPLVDRFKVNQGQRSSYICSHTLTSVQGRGKEDDSHCDREFRRKPLKILMILGVALEFYLQNEETNSPDTWIRENNQKCQSYT